MALYIAAPPSREVHKLPHARRLDGAHAGRCLPFVTPFRQTSLWRPGPVKNHAVAAQNRADLLNVHFPRIDAPLDRQRRADARALGQRHQRGHHPAELIATASITRSGR